MIGTGRTIVTTREEWVCPIPVHSSEMYKVLAYMESRAQESRAEVFVSADDENVIVWFNVEKAVPSTFSPSQGALS